MTADHGGGFAERLACLQRVAELGDGRLTPAVLTEARAVLQRARERLARGDHLVVAGLLGGTGSGKSALFNALAGRPLAPVGPVRPVTGDSRAAAIGEPAAAEQLLDWLGVDHRHHLAPGAGLPPGLVLVDLPDHDSVALDHALVADRFAERLDLLLWVVDPVKYAHGALYDRYLRRLSALAGVTVVILNRVDELDGADLDACARDLRRRLDAEDLGAAELVQTSAATGTGVDELRARLAHETQRRRAAAERISGDVRTVAARAAAELAEPRTVENLPVEAVAGAVASALDVPGAVAEAEAVYREAARGRSRSPGGAVLVGALRPVRRLARGAVELLPAGRAAAGRPGGDAGAGHPAVVRRALLDLADAAVGGSPGLARRRLRATVTDSAEPLLEQAGRAVRAATAPPPRRRWWPLLALPATAAEIAAALGLLWLAALRVPLFGLPDAPAVATPAGALPLPTVVVLAGLLARLLAAALRRALVRLGAARHGRRAARSLRAAVERAVHDRVVAPLEGEAQVQRELARAIACAGGGRHARRREISRAEQA